MTIFTKKQEAAIRKRDKNKCAMCGRTSAYGVEVFVVPVMKDAPATLANGQLLCEDHKHGDVSKLFAEMADRAQTLGDDKLATFATTLQTHTTPKQ